MKETFAVIGVLALMGIALLLILPMRLCSEAVDVAVDEAGPRALLKKYQWFKDASAALDEKKANIEVFTKRVQSLEDSYKGVERRDWPKDERERHGQVTTELAGLKASFNSLAAEYNAQMSKVNWAFCNVGELPKGADRPLPREYKAYILD